jgi:hypothetical protein
MLERFAAQSLVEHDGELIFSKEKFAELIVNECAKQLDVYKMMKLDSNFYSSMLREHFGVKR